MSLAEDAQRAYQQLIRQARELAILSSCSGSCTGTSRPTCPGAAGAPGRSEAHLAGLHHECATDPRFGELLAIVGGSDLVADPESPPAVNVRESCAGTMNERPGCRATWWKAWLEPPRWPSKSGSRGARPVLSVSARGWRR